MISRIDTPLPDETLASYLARVVADFPQRCRQPLGRWLTGIRGHVIIVDYPTRLQAVVDALGCHVGLNADDLVRRTTFLPLHAPFLTPERHDEVRRAMIDGDGAAPATLLGLHHGTPPAPASLRWCPVCREADLKDNQRSWWRRVAQVAGVDCCPIHGPLIGSQFRRSRGWKHDYPAVETAVDSGGAEEWDDLSIQLAKDVGDLLQGDFPPMGSEALRGAYFDLLQKRGYIFGERLRRTDLLHDFLASLSGRRLARLGLGYDPRSPYAWPAKLVLAQGGTHAPLRHLHMIRFLGATAASFMEMVETARPRARPRQGPSPEAADKLQELWVDRSVSLAAMERILGVHQHTVRSWASALGLRLPRPGSGPAAPFLKRLKKMRGMWLRLRLGKGRRRTRVLKWLSRNDHAWLAAHLIAPRAWTEVVAAVDWQRRDEELAAVVAAGAARVRAMRPFRKVSPTAIRDVLRVAGIVDGAEGRLPKFSAEVDKVIETWRSFALRRARTRRDELPDAPPWVVREKASVPLSLLKDREISKAVGYEVAVGNRSDSIALASVRKSGSVLRQ